MAARRHSSSWLRIALAAIAFAPSALRAQATDTLTSPVAAPYRAPVLAMVEPANGGAVPADRPVVVFRFAPGEADDPLDLRSFAVSVDGQDRSALFQVTAREAWGPLVSAASGSGATHGLSPGLHQVAARVCSSRGACTAMTATITAQTQASGDAPDNGTGGRHRLLDLLLSALRKLVIP